MGRRGHLARVAVRLAALTAALSPAGAVQAAAPLSKTPPAGFYRMMLGDYEVTALLDGTVAISVAKILTNTTPDDVGKALAREFLKDPVVLSDNAYLVNTGTKLVLIDVKAFADAAEKGYWVAAAHLASPGIGHLRKDGAGYAFVPANFAPAR